MCSITTTPPPPWPSLFLVMDNIPIRLHAAILCPVVSFQVLSRQIAELGIYPAVDPLDSTSRMLDPRVIGDVHYETARSTQKLLQDYKGLQVIAALPRLSPAVVVFGSPGGECFGSVLRFCSQSPFR